MRWPLRSLLVDHGVHDGVARAGIARMLSTISRKVGDIAAVAAVDELVVVDAVAAHLWRGCAARCIAAIPLGDVAESIGCGFRRCARGGELVVEVGAVVWDGVGVRRWCPFGEG